MQLVLSKNRVVAHGENFVAMGGVVINTETGARYENATVAECNGCPSDIDKVGYEYHGGVFVPCAPYGVGNNNGYFMEVCESCATPRNSGIPIKGGIKPENIHESFRASLFGGMDITLVWENASTSSTFRDQTLVLDLAPYTFLLIVTRDDLGEDDVFNVSPIYIDKVVGTRSCIRGITLYDYSAFGYSNPHRQTWRPIYVCETYISFENGFYTEIEHDKYTNHTMYEEDAACVPVKIYGVTI